MLAQDVDATQHSLIFLQQLNLVSRAAADQAAHGGGNATARVLHAERLQLESALHGEKLIGEDFVGGVADDCIVHERDSKGRITACKNYFDYFLGQELCQEQINNR